MHVPVGVIEDPDGYLHATAQRATGPIAVCGAGHIGEPWPGEFDTDDPRSCPTCAVILSDRPATPHPRRGQD
ncbi:MAG TPA: hypothetical protein VFJ17_04070 [Mycobacteriales bacterium]|nr:hypothetical protein [Mycobacteriales bacterium]